MKHNFINSEKGAAPVLLLVAAIGLLLFFAASMTLPLKDKLLSSLYPKSESQAATFSATGFNETLIAQGLNSATAMDIAPDGRIFVTLQGGQLRVVKNGQLLSTPFATFSVDSSVEKGLLGVTLDPNFSQNQYVYVSYSTPSNGPLRVARLTANGDVAQSGSQVTIFDSDPDDGSIHNGGAIHFGLDGKLYIAIGDNGEGTPSQQVTSFFGKLLRINKDGTIPTDNPTTFNTSNGVLTPAGKYRAIYALGLRNPFTFAVQPGTGRIFVNDVGDNGGIRWEEINDVTAGSNMGWPVAYGNQGDQNARYKKPIYTYQAGGCAITGGTFYNPSVNNFPAQYVGKYFFGDYCGGWIKVLDPSNGSVADFATNMSPAVDLKVGLDGSLYYLVYNSGSLYKISSTSAPSSLPSPTPSPSPVPSPSPSPIVNTPPTVTIGSPTTGTLYSIGQTINFSGSATDAEDGALSGASLNWLVEFHHNEPGSSPHIHPVLGGATPVTGTNGSFAVTNDHSTVNAFYRISLTATDSKGLQTTVSRDLNPRSMSLTLATTPTGLQVTLNGVPRTTPYTEQSVVGYTHQIGTSSPQSLNSLNYAFSTWSDNGTINHQVTVPTTNTTYTASFTQIMASPSPSMQPSVSPLPGDINGNGRVDIFDYNLLLTDFGATSGVGLRSDINKNGRVDIFDYNLLLTNFGRTQ